MNEMSAKEAIVSTVVWTGVSLVTIVVVEKTINGIQTKLRNRQIRKQFAKALSEYNDASEIQN